MARTTVPRSTPLPAGLTLTANGTLSGTVATPGTYPVTLRARDANLYFGTRDYQLKVNPNQVYIPLTRR